MSLKDQVLAAFQHEQANIKFNIKTEEGDSLYMYECDNQSTEKCFENFMALHTKHIDSDFK